MELEIQGSKCRKYLTQLPNRKRALHISLFLNDPFCNLEWKSKRPNTSGLYIKPKKVEKPLPEFGLNSLLGTVPRKALKILSQTPSPIKTPQKRCKKGKGLIYSPGFVPGPSEVALAKCYEDRRQFTNTLSRSLNIEKMHFSPKGKNDRRKAVSRLEKT